MNLPDDYYHCFLGNGLDAVLIGPTGSMAADKVSVDRCAWYKSDRYYPEDRLVMTAGRWPLDKPLEHAEGSGWYDAAPLGRTWYEVRLDGQTLEPQASQQRFVPQEGTLYSEVSFGPVRCRVTTFLHPSRSVLIVHCEFDREVAFRAWMGPGVWLEEGWDTDPFYSVDMRPNAPEGTYDLGETRGVLALRLEPAPTDFGAGPPGRERDRWAGAQGQVFTKYFGISDNRQGPLTTAFVDQAAALGYDALRAETLAFWRDYFAASSLRLPQEFAWAQYLYDASQYHFKAMQNPVSGGLPVNNLRRTWSSHVFWDSYFIQRALLESNHRAEALEACRFLQRTQPQAERHARDEFGAEGLKWDWEITHDGRKAYGALVHMKDQVHNNASYANEIWHYYDFTQDTAFLREFYPILEGLARFFLANVVEAGPDGYQTRPVVGVHESPLRVRNDGITVAGTIIILRRLAAAARLLGLEDELTGRAAAAARDLTRVLDRLYNGRFFQASQDSEAVNMSSIAPLYPMHVVDYLDPRAVQTVQVFLAQYKNRMVGHGVSDAGFPWAAGVLATVLARQGDGDTAWKIIEGVRPAMCCFGGLAEVMDDRMPAEDGQRWNMQYFGTAQGAVCTAIHNLLLQARGEDILLFPALPGAWTQARFTNLLLSGLTVTAAYEAGRVEGEVRNISEKTLSRRLIFGPNQIDLTLQPKTTHSFRWAA